MPIIKILPHAEYCPLGDQVDAPSGTSICEALLENGIAIEHACEMSCACTTCHVIVREGFDSLGEMDESEEDLLDRAWGLEPTSRLSCQAIVSNRDVTIEIPKYSINHAKEKHLGQSKEPTAAGSSAALTDSVLRDFRAGDRAPEPVTDRAQRVEDRVGLTLALAQQTALVQHLHEQANLELACAAGHDELRHRHVAVRQVTQDAAVDGAVVVRRELWPCREFEFLHIPRVGPRRPRPCLLIRWVRA